ncbi:acyl-CoA dehydrogenase, partial [Amycolatopsis sp. NPDC000673]
ALGELRAEVLERVVELDLASDGDAVGRRSPQLAARTGLQLHGAIGYTLECDLSLWLLRVRALVGCWGTPSVHRARVLESLMRGR